MGLFQNHMMAAAAAATADTTYTIDNSCRFDINDTAYLARDVATTLSNKFTYSFWVKRCTFGTYQYIVTWRDGTGAGSPYGMIQFNNDDTLSPFEYDTVSSANYPVYTVTNAKFRDPSAWYHIVVNFDYTRDTADRVRVYANGALQTFGTNSNSASAGTPQSQATGSDGNFLGVAKIYNTATQMGDFYTAEMQLVSDAALAASEFGKTNSDGVWVPKEYSGSYGDEGHFLDFESSGDLGNDVSGNNNDFTSSGLAATDQMTDTPTNNHCTWNPLNKSTSTLLRDGNLNAIGNGGGDWFPILGTQAVESGKWYIEFKMEYSTSTFLGVGNTNIFSGVAGAAFTNVRAGLSAGYTDGASYRSDDGNLYEGGNTNASWGDTWTTDDIIGIAIDADTGKVWFAKNNSWQASGDPAAGTNEAATVTTPITIYGAFYSTNGEATMRSAEVDWSYSAPSGFNAINTANIAAPAITDPSAQFQTQLYTGDGTAIGSGGKAVTFTGNSNLSPDLVWIKNRDATDSHALYDSVRGTTEQLESDTYAAETTETEGVTTFGSDGFTVGSLDQVNTNTEDYVSWNWAEGATPGFDIVSYTGDGANRAISHSLGAVPKMIAVKMRSDTYEWTVYHEAMGNTKMMKLNASEAPSTASTFWQDTTPTSSVFSVGTHGNVNKDTETFIAYLWAEVDGFSKFGSYTGNGTADGPFVYCGFKPRMVIIKEEYGTANWFMFNSAIATYNVMAGGLQPSTTAVEGTQDILDFLSNGFKIRHDGTVNSVNDSGISIIFAAFAENPFGGDGVAPATAR
jgi:hypothetical protein